MTRNAKLIALIAILVLSGIGAAGAPHMMSGAGRMMGESRFCGPGYPMMQGWDNGATMMPPGMMMGPGMMAPGGMGPGMMMAPGTVAGMSAALELSDDQKQKIDAIAGDAQQRMRDLMRDLHAERLRMQELFYADEPDSAALSKQMKKLADQQQRLFDLQLETRDRLRAVLTKTQAAELKRWRHQWMMGG